jgi:WD40 repeat protein
MRAVCIGVILAVCGIASPADAQRTITAGKQSVHLAFFPDGKTLAVSSGDSLKLYDAATGKELLAFMGHAWPIHSVAFSPDGKLLATGGGGLRDGRRSGEVQLWDTATGQAKLSPEFWPGSDVQAVVFSPDGKSVAAGGLRGLRVWETATGMLRKEIEMDAAVLVLVYAPDGKTLAAGAFTGYAHLWDTRTWKETLLKGHKSEVRALAYSPDAKTLVTGGVGEFKVWDAAGKLRKTIKQPETVWAVAFAPDGKTLAVGSGEPRADLKGAVDLWDTERWSEVRRWASAGGMVGSLAISPDGKHLAAGRFGGVIEVHDTVAR